VQVDQKSTGSGVVWPEITREWGVPLPSEGGVWGILREIFLNVQVKNAGFYALYC